MLLRKGKRFAWAIALSAILAQPLYAGSAIKGGVNLSGGEFNPTKAKRGIDYNYPSSADVSAAASAGFQFVRVPFLAKRLLRTDGDAAAELEQFVSIVDLSARKGLVVVLDMHDYGFTRDGELIGSTDTSERSFAESWAAIAGIFANRPHVLFGLMNEPHFQTAATWRHAVNAR